MNSNNEMVIGNWGYGQVAKSRKFLNTHFYNDAISKWRVKPTNNNRQAPKPQRTLRNRFARAFRRYIGKNTVNGNKIYKGPRGGLFTANGTPVRHAGNGVYKTN